MFAINASNRCPHVARAVAARIVIALGVGGATLAPTGAAALDEVTYQWAWIPDGVFAPTSAGIAKGFYREAGIELKTFTGRGSGDAVRRVAGGSAMFGDGDIANVMSARVKEKAAVKCMMYWQNDAPHSMFVLESSGIKTFKDLAGKTIATTPGNTHRTYFPFVARMAGLDPESVKWTTTDPATMPSLLVAKRVDAAGYQTVNSGYIRPQVEAMGDKLRIILYRDYGFDIYGYCAYVREDLIRDRPDLVRRFAAAMQRSYLWANDNPEETARIHSKRFPDTKYEQILAGWNDLRDYMFGKDRKRPWTGHFDMAKVQRTYDVVAQSQELDPKADVKQFVDDSFLPPKK